MNSMVERAVAAWIAFDGISREGAMSAALQAALDPDDEALVELLWPYCDPWAAEMLQRFTDPDDPARAGWLAQADKGRAKARAGLAALRAAALGDSNE